MIFARTLERWLRRDRYAPAHEAGGLCASTAQGHIGRAAPREGLLAAIDLSDLLANHAALIDRIRIGYAGAEGSFEAQVAPLIRRFAAFVHLLPATCDGHFRHPGGCLQCGLEIGFHALQAVDGQIFSARGTVPERRAAAPRWRAAALATGLCMEVHRPIFGATVHDEHGAQWNPLLIPLFDWLQQCGRERYSIEWPHTGVPPRPATLAILPRILGSSLIEFLADPDRTILDHMVAAIAAPPGAEPNALGAIIEQTLSRVVARDLRRTPNRHPTLPAVEAVGLFPPEEPSDPEGALAPAGEGTGSASMVSTGDLPALDPARVQAAEQVRKAEDAPHAALASAPVAELPASAEPVRRRVAIPATLNPVVAEALLSLLSPAAGGAPASGVEISGEGIYVPLVVWEQRGLDTGLVVRTLHDARLLVLQGARKVWRKRRGEEDVAGLMLTAKLLA